MKKNVSGQVIGAQMVSATDGSAFTGSVTAYVTGDGGTQSAGSVGSGACTHEGNGYHTYAPAQAETNYNLIAFTFTGTGAVPATVQVFTSFPQTGDNFARLGAPAGVSVSADVAAIKAVADDVLTDTGTTIPAQISGLNDLDSTEVQTAAAAALTAYDPPTYAELVSLESSVVGSVNLYSLSLAQLSLRSDSAVVTDLSTRLSQINADLGSGAGDYAPTADSNEALRDCADAVKAKTDSLTFTVAGQVDSNIQYVNDVAVQGDGQTGTEWGPA